jgi:lipopolysaccharide export system permease protein
MTRLLDRYVLGIFLPAVLLFTVTLLFLFVAVDFARNLGRFLEMKDPGGPLYQFILMYYLYRIPLLMLILIPAVTLFAPTFTVIKLARANEILPIAASGISLHRMSLPFVAAAALAGLTMAAMDEFVLPMVGPGISATEAMRIRRNFDFNVEDWDGQTQLWGRKYTLSDQLLSEGVRITRLDEAKEPIEVIIAERCQWNAKLKRWVAFEGSVEHSTIIVYEPGMKPRIKTEPIPKDGYVVNCKLTPETLRKDMGGAPPDTFLPLRNQIREMRRYPHVPSIVIRVHQRFSFPLSPLVLLLVGLPFVMDPHSKSFIKGLIFSFLLALGYYVAHFACIDLGNRGGLPPIVAAWLPISAFGAVGLVAFSRMRT